MLRNTSTPHAAARACAIAAGILLLVACGSSQSQSTANPGDPAQPMASPDDPSRPAAGTGAPMGPGPDDCSRETALDCPDGMVDGCLVEHPEGGDKRLTAYHVCVQSTETSAQECVLEIARECGDELIDACLADPPASDMHICVQRR